MLRVLKTQYSFSKIHLFYLLSFILLAHLSGSRRDYPIPHEHLKTRHFRRACSSGAFIEQITAASHAIIGQKHELDNGLKKLWAVVS